MHYVVSLHVFTDNVYVFMYGTLYTCSGMWPINSHAHIHTVSTCVLANGTCLLLMTGHFIYLHEVTTYVQYKLVLPNKLNPDIEATSIVMRMLTMHNWCW